MCGGAATGRVTPQIIAAVTGLPVACQTGGEGSLLGAAILARALTQTDPRLEQLARDMTPPTVDLDPGSEADVYREVYQCYLASLRPGQAADRS
jgi:sugar (pentulose or hexulose) kinase